MIALNSELRTNLTDTTNISKNLGTLKLEMQPSRLVAMNTVQYTGQ
jgi:hypothetical protein